MKGKGKHWGSLTAPCGSEYQQKSSGAQGRTSGTKSSMLDKSASKEYQQKSSGESHGGSPSGKFLGATKGNKDFNPNHTKNTPHGSYKGS
jgi:hypothetical protein